MSEAVRPDLVDVHGRPLRPATRLACPRCGAAPERRVVSGGFGQPQDLCGVCGYPFQELTVMRHE